MDLNLTWTNLVNLRPKLSCGQARNQPVFSQVDEALADPMIFWKIVYKSKWRRNFEGPFCLSCTFIFRNERYWMKKNARVSEKLVSPGLFGLLVATRLVVKLFANSFMSKQTRKTYTDLCLNARSLNVDGSLHKSMQLQVNNLNIVKSPYILFLFFQLFKFHTILSWTCISWLWWNLRLHVSSTLFFW